MDIKKTLSTALMFIAIFLAVQLLMNHFWPKKPPAGAPGAAAPAVAFGEPTSQPASEQGATPQKIRLGNPDRASKDKLSVTVDTQTAGIDLVQLNINDYPQTVKRLEPLTLLEAQPKLPKPYSTLAVDVTATEKGGAIKPYHFDLFAAQYIWKLDTQTPYSARLLATMTDDTGKPLIQVTKTFTVNPATYDLEIDEAVQNKSTQPITVRIDDMTSTSLPKGDLPQEDRYFQAGQLVVDKKEIVTNTAVTQYAEMEKITGTSKEIGAMNDFGAGKSPFLWTAQANRFFAAITRPVPMAPGAVFSLDGASIPAPNHVASSQIDILYHDPDDLSKSIYGIQFNGAPLTVAPGGTATFPMTAFLGPKDRNLLHGKESAPVGSDLYEYFWLKYESIIQFSRSGCFIYALCTFDFLAKFLLWLLDQIAHYVTFGNYGLAIMLLVVIIRFCLHPLTRASQINMAKMGQQMNKIKPQLEKVKEKYKDDSKKQQEETMRIYRENNVNPAGGIMGCLPMMLQMPIWIAMWQGLWADLDLRFRPFIPGWINDLAAPDALFTFHTVTVPLIHLQFSSFNLLPILLGIVFFFQMKIQTATQPKPTDEQQAQIQKYSQFMFLLFPLFLYNAPSGLNLYYFASTTAGLVDTYIVRKALKKQGILPANAKDLPTHYEEDDNDEGHTEVRRKK